MEKKKAPDKKPSLNNCKTDLTSNTQVDLNWDTAALRGFVLV